MDMKIATDKYISILESDISVVAKDFKAASEYLKTSSAVFTRGQLQFLAVPKLFTNDAYSVIESAAKTIYNILDKVICRYLVDKEYRKLFPFSKQLENLILTPCGYDVKLPIARVDIFFNEEDYSFKFCEFNADGASAMNEDRELVNAWKNSHIWREYTSEYNMQSFELFASWVNTFLKIYSSYEGRVENPSVAIVDFLDIGTKSEFSVFKKAFECAGVSARILDIRELKYKDGRLQTIDGQQIDAIYRRAVTSECIEHYDQIQDFINAVLDKKVCLIGGFRTQIIHDKNIFRILRMDQSKELFTAQENAFIEEHIPMTFKLETNSFPVEDVIDNKDKWLIKPANKYGSKGVATGGDYNLEEWIQIIKDRLDGEYILQEYCTPYKRENLFFENDTPRYGEYNNMTGIFLYAGVVAGLYSRLTTERVTTTQNEGRVVCSLLVNK
ncbi:MAG: glutathionylspermidine synthase family protein [Christensenellaceae bacterium]|jgi:hypothetical protein|nr:glutathionylspermidine synthase family protein [Christensenellaceae bacterium]